ncbi:MAG: hypothetical protein ACOYN0_05985, partial [Phycisphaerales bacterium]
MRKTRDSFAGSGGRCGKPGAAVHLLAALAVLVGLVMPAAAQQGDPDDGGPDCSSAAQLVPQWTVLPSEASESACLWGPLSPYYSDDRGPLLARYGDAGTYSPAGFRLNVNLIEAHVPGDFVHPSPTLGGTSLPLIPPGMAGAPTGWQGDGGGSLGRPTLAGAADLLTGAPLARVVDLELPFRGATFRLARTRSAVGPYQRAQRSRGVDSDRWWDFTGGGWMIGENPILLIDSAIPDIVGNTPATCWFIVDAFQSIPFQRLESSGRYEAPARFRARMEHNGVWAQRSWSVPPTEYKVTLYDGAVTYTFNAHRQDVPDHHWDRRTLDAEANPRWAQSSYHARPFLPQQFPDGRLHDPWNDAANPGIGIPYYATCSKIEDRYGHVVEMTYERASWFFADHTGTVGCIECAQNCPSKGQLRTVRLSTRRADESLDTAWTLVYSHRIASPIAGPSLDEGTQAWNTLLANSGVYGVAAIDRIYVYEGDATAQLDGSGFVFTIPPTDPMKLGDGSLSLDGGTDPLAATAQASPLRGWKHCVRYHYDYRRTSERPEHTGRVNCPPTLLKTTMLDADPVSGVRTRTRAFVYSTLSSNEANGQSLPWLEGVFEPEELSRLLASAASDACPSSAGVQPLLNDVDGTPFGVNDLVEQRWTGVSGCEVREPVTGKVLIPPGAKNRLLAYATRQWNQSGPSDATPPEQGLVTAPNSRRSYIDGVAPSSVGRWGVGAAVRSVSVRDSSGTWRHYRMYKYWVPPAGTLGAPSESQTFASLLSDSLPHRSVFAAPYAWRGYAPADRAALTQPGQQLENARYITIVDEFDSQAARDNPVYGEGSHAQTQSAHGLRARAVSYLNAAGVELKRREWSFDANGTGTVASGVGEEFVYRTAAQYFNATPDPSDNVPDAGPGGYVQPGGTAGPVRGPLEADPFTSLRTTLLLVEHRTVGWSVADLQNRGTSDGLVNFYEYRRRDTVIPPSEGSQDPARTQYSAEQVAEGIARGSPLLGSAAKYYTSQTFSREAATWMGLSCEMNAAVVFTRPRTTKLAACPQPGESPDSWDGFAPTFSLTLRDQSQADVAAPERRVTRTLAIGAPRRQRPEGTPGGELWFYPIDGAATNEYGQQTWAVNGLVTNPLAPQEGDPLQACTLTYYVRDGYGQPWHTVLDAAPGTALTPAPDTGAPFVVATDCPWPRISDTPAHNYLTSFGYSRDNRLTDTFLPNNRRWASRVVVLTRDERGLPMPRDKWFAREYIFSDLVSASGAAGMFFTETVAEIRDYWGPRPEGAPKATRKVDMTGAFRLQFADESERPLNYRERAAVRVAPDANGRITSAELLEADDDGNLFAVGSKEINDLVDVLREREIDGSITRTTRNRLGQTLRTYAGTKDDGWVAPNDLEGRPLPYDMILRTRVEYGAGVNDVQRPTVTRSYTSNPSWARDHHGAAPIDDPDGIATTTAYDWCGRAVRSDTYPRGVFTPSSKRRQTSLTFLDFADRVVLEVTFGENAHALPPALDPAKLGPTDAIPAPEAFLSLNPPPTGLASTHYGPDGSVAERRAYDVASVVPSYVSTFTYLGRDGQAVLTHTVGESASVASLDGVGRTKSVASVAPGRGSGAYAYELSRTDFTYDTDGNIITTARWERTRDAGDVLDESNAVASRSHGWFDNNKRQIASIDVGTESGDTFNNTPEAQRWSRTSGPFGDPNVKPRIGCEGADPTMDPGALDDKMFDHCETGNSLRLLNTEGLADAGRFTISRYNKSAQLTHTRNADGTVTIQRYAPSGRLAAKIENAWGDPALQRTTRYRYRLGRLVEMVASRDAAQTETEHTEVVYGAQIVDDSFTVVSRDNGLVGRLYLPHPVTGRTRVDGSGATIEGADGFTTAPAITLRYTFTGQIAERIDARGLSFRYRYDDQARLASIEVGHYRGLRAATNYVPGRPVWLSPTGGAVPVSVGYVEYGYGSRGELEHVRAFESRAKKQVIAHNRFETDTRGHLLAEYQALGAVVSAQTPAVRYRWTTTPADHANPVALEAAIDRLEAILYPAHANGLPTPSVGRDVTFIYGARASLDSQLDRVTSLTSRGAEAAGFSYSGESRRSSQTWGRDAGGAAQLVSSISPIPQAAGFGAMDEFGRRTRLNVSNSAGVTLFEASYRFDNAGNRLSATLTQSTPGGAPVVNDASQLNTFDQLNRLTSTQHGQVVVGPEGLPAIVPGTGIQSERWSLDLLGNWTGRGGGSGTTGPPGLERTGNLDQSDTPWGRLTADPQTDIERTWHSVTRRNSLDQITALSGDLGGTPTQRSATTVHDGAGSIVFDGQLVYIYDAWARIIEVRRGTLNPTTPAPDPASDEPPSPYARVTVGEVVKTYAYDGLGRLVTTTTPLPPTQGVPKRTRTERFLYDGVRRVQEYVTESPATAGAAPTNRLEREYLWGPGDGVAGVDELLAQYDTTGKAWWVVQDGGGDIVSLIAAAGGQHPYARVAAQWRYDGYGMVTSAEYFEQHPEMRAGHKGLFADRLDAGTSGVEHDGLPTRDGYGGFTPGGAEPPRLAPYATTIYHVRNRNYAPHLGRWLQVDPNASGRDVLSAAAYAGRGFGALSMAFGLEEMYGDGGSLYGYLGGNGWERWDPEGLSWDPFSVVDDYMEEMAAERAAFLSAIGQDLKAVAIVGATI